MHNIWNHQHNGNSFIFIFLISKRFIDIKKGEHPSTQGVYKGSNNQEQKLQESKKSRKDKNDWFHKAVKQFYFYLDGYGMINTIETVFRV